MKYKIVFFLFLFFINGLQSFSQIEKPKKKPFNIGIYEGFGGVNANSFPSVDLNYKRAMFRLSPGFQTISAGLMFELKSITPTFFNCYWVASVYGSGSSYKGFYARKQVAKLEHRTDYAQRLAVLTGVKIYFGKRWYSIAQLGVQYINTDAYTIVSPQPNGLADVVFLNPHKREWLPYFEFGIGINIFKTYPTCDDISN
jgi:hypothetical protein